MMCLAVMPPQRQKLGYVTFVKGRRPRRRAPGEVRVGRLRRLRRAAGQRHSPRGDRAPEATKAGWFKASRVWGYGSSVEGYSVE